MSGTGGEPAEAIVRVPGRFNLIWLVPIVAALLAAYLGWQTLEARGPLITITFGNGAGLSAGQTNVEHNAVSLGTVESVTLSDNFNQVITKVRIAKSATAMLTDHARFWVVRPRFSLTDLSGLQTLVSGSYIAVDPGGPGGKPQTTFHGLDQPPGVQSDQPGKTFTLRSPRLGWLNTGAPVFYQDIPVGRLVDYQDPGLGQPIIMHVFIRSPYDQYVRTATHFWNTSGVNATIGPSGVHVAIESLEAVVAGGIDFANFEDAAKAPAASQETIFPLFTNFDEAQNAGFHDNIHYVTYFNQSVAGLEPGSAVQLYGIRVGTVIATQLQLNIQTGEPRVRVTFDVQPERVFSGAAEVPHGNTLLETRKMVGLGLRARIDTGNLITGQEVIGLDKVPNAPAADVTKEGEMIVWPSQPGGLQNLTDTVGDIANKLDALPLDKLGSNADALITSLRDLAATADSDLKPLGSAVPEVSRQVQETLQKTDKLLASLQNGYGSDSDTHRNLQELAMQATQAISAIRELTNYLARHPGSVVWGRQ